MRPLLSIFVIAICVGAYFMYIKPMSVEVRVLNAKKAEYNHLLNTVQEIKEKRDAVLLDYNTLSPEEIDKLNKIIPATLNPVLYLNDISSLALKNNLLIKDYRVADNQNGVITATETVSVNSYKTTNITIRVSGSYQQFLNFMNEIESALSLTDVVSLKIDAPGSGTMSPSGQIKNVVLPLDYTLEAKVYSLK